MMLSVFLNLWLNRSHFACFHFGLQKVSLLAELQKQQMSLGCRRGWKLRRLFLHPKYTPYSFSKSKEWTGVLCSWVSQHLFICSSTEMFELCGGNLLEVKGSRKWLVCVDAVARGRDAQQCHEHCANNTR